MAICFFVNEACLDSQAANKGFGPISSEVYRTTSLHTIKSNTSEIPTAIAAVDGLVAVQDIPGSNPPLVNLILKPNRGSSLGDLSIAYFIYRGILKSSLIEIDQNGNQFVTSNLQNDLINIINIEAHNQLKNSTKDPNIPFQPVSAEILGLGSNVSSVPLDGNFAIDELFVNSKRMQVFAGFTIGEFSTIQNNSTSHFGLDILLYDQNYLHTLGDVRKLIGLIELSPYSNQGNPTQLEEEKRRYEKEKILAYVDPCAYYGFYGTINNLSDYFFNHDLIYIDIRNENNLSYSFYEDSTILLKDIKLGNNNLGNLSYNVDGWPLFKYKFSSNANNQVPTNKDFLTIEFKVSFEGYKIEDNERIAFRLCGDISDNNKLISPLTDSQKVFEEKLSNELFPISNNWATIGSNSSKRGRILATKVIDNGSTRKISSTYIRIFIHRVPSLATSKSYELRSQSFLDNLFLIKKHYLDFIDPNSPNCKQLFFELSGHVKFIKDDSLNIHGLYESGIAIDETRVFFFAVPKIISYYNEFENKFDYQPKLDDRVNFTGIGNKSVTRYINSCFESYALKKSQIHLPSADPIAPNSSVDVLYFLPYLNDQNKNNALQSIFLLGISKNEFQNFFTEIQVDNLPPQANKFNLTLHPISLKLQNLGFFRTINVKLLGIKNSGTAAGTSTFIDDYKIPTLNLYSIQNFIICSNQAAQSEGIVNSPITPFAEGDLNVDISQLQTSDANHLRFHRVLDNLIHSNKYFRKVLKRIFQNGYTKKITFRINHRKNPDPIAQTLPLIAFDHPELKEAEAPFVDYSFDEIIIEFFHEKMDIPREDLGVAQVCIHELIHAMHYSETLSKIIGYKPSARYSNNPNNPNNLNEKEKNVDLVYRMAFLHDPKLNNPNEPTILEPKAIKNVEIPKNCIYQKYYKRFGWNDLGNEKGEYDWTHNMMAYIERKEIIIDCLKEFNNNSLIPTTEVKLRYVVFTPTPVIKTLYKNDSNFKLVYEALSWLGLLDTRAYREYANNTTKYERDIGGIMLWANTRNNPNLDYGIYSNFVDDYKIINSNNNNFLKDNQFIPDPICKIDYEFKP